MRERWASLEKGDARADLPVDAGKAYYTTRFRRWLLKKHKSRRNGMLAYPYEYLFEALGLVRLLWRKPSIKAAEQREGRNNHGINTVRCWVRELPHEPCPQSLPGLRQERDAIPGDVRPSGT